MPRTLRNQVIVGQDHSVTVRAPELQPGAKVEVIVRLTPEAQISSPGTSFVDAVAGVEIDAPPEYSTEFEDALYPARLES
jgi:hypothetical protein